MRKFSFQDVKNALKRDEMRMISGGCGCATYTGGGGDSGCVSSCFSDSDCNCMPCYSYPGSPMKACKLIVCDSRYNNVRYACSC